MNGQAQVVPPKVAKPWLKFLIGFVGGICAAIFPRLMAALALYGGSDVVLLSTGYLGIAVLFAVLVGAVVMIMEWGVLREPRATFMTALGIPALLAGALNTSNGAYELDNQAKESNKLAELVQSLSQIPEISADSLAPLSDAGAAAGTINPLALLGIGMAYAGDGGTGQTVLDFNPAMQVQQRQYYIVLDRAKNANEARQKANALKSDVPNARAVQAGNKFLVIDPEPRPRSKAVMKAIRLKKELRDRQLKPQLLRVK